jgi:hypothetical protein
MLNVINDQRQLCLSVANKPIMLSVIMLNVIMLSVVEPSGRLWPYSQTLGQARKVSKKNTTKNSKLWT